jgi:hypothetical protein
MQPVSALWSNNVKGLKGKPARQHGRIIVGVGVLPSDKSRFNEVRLSPGDDGGR